MSLNVLLVSHKLHTYLSNSRPGSCQKQMYAIDLVPEVHCSPTEWESL